MSFELTDEWLADLLAEEEAELYDPNLYILGLDPGGTTGVAMVVIDRDDDEVKPELIYLHQIADGRYGFKDWFNGSQVRENLIIVSEKWKERNIKGANREPQYIEGSMHMLWDDDNIEYQYPDQKELIPDQWLKDNNLWTENRRHQMDALKHIFAYLRNQEHSATLESLTGEDAQGNPVDTEPMAQPGEAERAQVVDPSQKGSGDGDDDGAGEGEGEPGEGEGGNPQDFQELMEGILAGAGGGESSDDDQGGEGRSGGMGQELDAESLNEKDYKTTPRELNGAFVGFNPSESGGTAKVLFED